MPLRPGSSHSAKSKNISMLMDEGKPHKQAIAIALDVARKARALGGPATPAPLPTSRPAMSDVWGAGPTFQPNVDGHPRSPMSDVWSTGPTFRPTGSQPPHSPMSDVWDTGPTFQPTGSQPMPIGRRERGPPEGHQGSWTRQDRMALRDSREFMQAGGAAALPATPLVPNTPGSVDWSDPANLGPLNDIVRQQTADVAGMMRREQADAQAAQAQTLASAGMGSDSAGNSVGGGSDDGTGGGTGATYADGGGVRTRTRTRLHTGPIHSAVAGRTDHLPMRVPNQAYVLPADIVSGMGQGNTLAGFNIAKSLPDLFHQSLYGTPKGDQQPYKEGALYGQPVGVAAPYSRRGVYGHSMPKAKGGRANDDDEGVPIVAAGGEHVYHPDEVAHIGGGDIDFGHDLLDEFVKSYRASLINHLSKLPGPKKD